MDSRESTEIKKQNSEGSEFIFGIHGGGSIGLGLMADVALRSFQKYKIIATSNDKFLVDMINNTGKYTLFHRGEEKSSSSTTLQNVKMISRDPQDILELYKQAKIVALCLTPVAMKASAMDITKAIIARGDSKDEVLCILVLMNIPQCDKFVSDLVQIELTKLGKNREECSSILKKVQFIPTVIDRVVTKISEEEVKQQLKRQILKSFSYDKLNKDVDTILTDNTELSIVIKQLNLDPVLFYAERDFAFYVPATFNDSIFFSAMQRVNYLEQIEAIKNKYINGPHAIIAWLGALYGCKTIAETIRLPIIRKYVKKLMDTEIQPVMKAEYPNLTTDELQSLRKLFIRRCLKSTDDPVTRVGRDPLRKINANGRIRGTIELAQKHNLKCPTIQLERGLAAAILYALKGIDNSNPGCQQIQHLYQQSKGDYTAVLCYSGTSPAGEFKGFDRTKDELLINNILSHIAYFEGYFGALDRALKYRMVLAPSSTYLITRYVSNQFAPTNVRLSQLKRLLSPQTPIANRFTVKQTRLLCDNTIEEKKSDNSPNVLHLVRSKLFNIARSDMKLQEDLLKFGIALDLQNGHISYLEHFKPVQIKFELVFIRHGETFGNCGQATLDGKIDPSLVEANTKNHHLRIFQGNVDDEINQLTKHGREQAEKVAIQLENELLHSDWIPDVVFYSPLLRAKETGLPFITRNKLDDRYIELAEIREMSFGSWDNRRVCDFNPDDECHKFYLSQNALVKSSGINGTGKLQNAENFCEVLLRAHQVLRQINERYQGKKVIMFSHSMFGAACCILLGKGQTYENDNYLAFDGKKKDGTPYTIPNATPCYLSVNFNKKQLTNIKP